MKAYMLALQGRAHAAREVPCQDAAACAEGGGASSVALADGAGSARLSHFGAKAAAETAAAVLVRDFDSLYTAGRAVEAADAILAETFEKLDALAGELGCSLPDLASTLAFAAVKDGRYISGSLGDSTLAYLRDGTVRSAVPAAEDDGRGGTWFTTSPRALARMRLFKGELKSVRGFILMSDGMAESLYSRRERRFSPLAARLIADSWCRTDGWMEREAGEFLRERALARTADDCSLAVLPLFSGYRELFAEFPEEVHREFFYRRGQAGEHAAEYRAVLSFSDAAADREELAALAGIGAEALDRRLKRLGQLGFAGLERFRRP